MHVRAFGSFILLSLLIAYSAASPNDAFGAGRPISDGTSRETSESLGHVASPIIGGTPSDTSQNSVVLLFHYDPSTDGWTRGCTGTLLAPKLVLTARHCVASDVGAPPFCDETGRPIGGSSSDLGPNDEANTFDVFAGREYSDLTRAARSKQIFDDGADIMCNHDIALIVLDTAIEDMPISPVRLDSDVEVDEPVTAVGWGLTEESVYPEVRQQRTVNVTGVGPRPMNETSLEISLPPNEFEVGESGCFGDSGSPALATTGAVVGVLTRGFRWDEAYDPNDPVRSCVGGSNTKVLYTKLSPFKDLLLKGYEAAGAEPWLEGEPDPRRSSSSGCSASPAGLPGSGVFVVALASLGAAIVRRRQTACS